MSVLISYLNTSHRLALLAGNVKGQSKLQDKELAEEGQEAKLEDAATLLAKEPLLSGAQEDEEKAPGPPARSRIRNDGGNGATASAKRGPRNNVKSRLESNGAAKSSGPGLDPALRPAAAPTLPTKKAQSSALQSLHAGSGEMAVASGQAAIGGRTRTRRPATVQPPNASGVVGHERLQLRPRKAGVRTRSTALK